MSNSQKMSTLKLIGVIQFKLLCISTNEILRTDIRFEEDDENDIYYCWQIIDKNEIDIATKCLPISKRVIVGDKLDFCINHAKESINSFRIRRKKIFQVQEIEKL